MAILQIVSNQAGGGKTALAGALLMQGLQGGRKVAYYKPFSRSLEQDPDVGFVSRLVVDGETSEPTKPYPPAGSRQGAIPEIKSVVDRLSAANDFVLVEGPDLSLPDGGSSTLTADVAALLESHVLLLVRYAKGLNAAGVVTLAQRFERRLEGIIINGVPRHRSSEVHRRLLPELMGSHLPVWGALPEERALAALAIRQIADHLAGTWLQEPAHADIYVERFLIGANIMDSGASYFGRFPNQAVITRGGRPDIQMASMVEGTKLLILTEGTEPVDYIKAEASHWDLPMMLVQQNTVATAEKLETVPAASIHSRAKIQHFAQLMQDNLDQGALESVFR